MLRGTAWTDPQTTMMEGEAALKSVQEELKRIQAELGAVHQAQQMLIEDNQTQHMELAEFKVHFEAKLPQVAATAGAQQKLVNTLKLLQEYDTNQEYEVNLCYRDTRNRHMVADYRIQFIEDEDFILGTWEHYVRVLPFTVHGRPSYMDDRRWPSIVLWHNMQELETLALDQLVKGGNQWELAAINVIPEDGDDGQPTWDIDEGTPYLQTTVAVAEAN